MGCNTKDGYWLHPTTGRQRGGMHQDHEWNMRDLKVAMNEVGPCDCWKCRGEPEPPLPEWLSVLKGWKTR